MEKKNRKLILFASVTRILQSFRKGYRRHYLSVDLSQVFVRDFFMGVQDKMKAYLVQLTCSTLLHQDKRHLWSYLLDTSACNLCPPDRYILHLKNVNIVSLFEIKQAILSYSISLLFFSLLHVYLKAHD